MVSGSALSAATTQSAELHWQLPEMSREQQAVLHSWRGTLVLCRIEHHAGTLHDVVGE